ncbi:hypothetical protein H5410_045849 [Solanum commersonii]|uniref:Uncharacterized protein n=1 Tax=Solanum commersonii TaxID=4109 RepID=A0A9J5XCU0_SOLCO|nr:hypothetical protein H5410_045849 [Solanum commersonii]
MLYMSNLTCILHISVLKVINLGGMKLTMESSFSIGIVGPILNLKQSIRLWWAVEGNYRVKRMNTIIRGGSFSEFKGNVAATLGLLFFQNWNSTNLNFLLEWLDETLILLIYGSAALIGNLKKIIVLVQFQISETTNLVAEARAIRESLNYCIKHEISNIIIQTDFLVMVIEKRYFTRVNIPLEKEIRLLTNFKKFIAQKRESLI